MLLIVVLLQGFFSGETHAQGTDFKPDLSMDLRQFQEKVLKPKNEIWIVDFWASWCRPCIEVLPEIMAIQEKFKDKKVRFISISHDENKVDWMSAIVKFKIPWNQILIPNATSPQPFLDKIFPHKGIPSLFIVTPEGKVKKTDEGILEVLLERQLKKMK